MLKTTKNDYAINLNQAGSESRMGDVERGRRLNLLQPLFSGKHPSGNLPQSPQQIICSEPGCSDQLSIDGQLLMRSEVEPTMSQPLFGEQWATIRAALILERAARI